MSSAETSRWLLINNSSASSRQASTSTHPSIRAGHARGTQRLHAQVSTPSTQIHLSRPGTSQHEHPPRGSAAPVPNLPASPPPPHKATRHWHGQPVPPNQTLQGDDGSRSVWSARPHLEPVPPHGDACGGGAHRSRSPDGRTGTEAARSPFRVRQFRERAGLGAGATGEEGRRTVLLCPE